MNRLTRWAIASFVVWFLVATVAADEPSPEIISDSKGFIPVRQLQPLKD